MSVVYTLVGDGEINSTMKVTIPQKPITKPTLISLPEYSLRTDLFYPENRSSFDYSNLTGPEYIANINETTSDFRFLDTPFELNVKWILELRPISALLWADSTGLGWRRRRITFFLLGHLKIYRFWPTFLIPRWTPTRTPKRRPAFRSCSTTAMKMSRTPPLRSLSAPGGAVHFRSPASSSSSTTIARPSTSFTSISRLPSQTNPRNGRLTPSSPQQRYSKP